MYIISDRGFDGLAAASDFRFSDTNVDVSSVVISGNVIIVTTTSPITTSGVTLSYNGDSLFDSDGNLIPPFTAQVQTQVDSAPSPPVPPGSPGSGTAPPPPPGVFADGTSVYIISDRGFDGLAAASDFRFSDTNVDVSSVVISGNVIIVTTTSPITTSGVTLSYNGDSLFDSDGNLIPPFTAQVQTQVDSAPSPPVPPGSPGSGTAPGSPAVPPPPPPPGIFNFLQFFQDVSDAYTTLSDPESLQEYLDLLITTDSGDGLDPDDPDDETVFDFDEESTDTDTSLSLEGEGDDTDIGIDDGGADDEDEEVDVVSPGAPEAPENLRTEDRRANSIDLAWDSSLDNGSQVSEYQVRQYQESRCAGSAFGFSRSSDSGSEPGNEDNDVRPCPRTNSILSKFARSTKLVLGNSQTV